MTLANRITLSRLPILILILILLYFGDGRLKLLAFLLTIALIAMDFVDGMVARRRNESSTLGSVLDIAIDRIVEVVYWIAFAHLALVPVWVPMLVAARGILTDSLRGLVLAESGQTAFGMMRSRLGSWLVSGRFMRAFYGFAKATSFAGLALLLALRDLYPGALWLAPLHTLLLLLVYATVSITLLRGLPVLAESRQYLGGEAAKGAS